MLRTASIALALLLLPQQPDPVPTLTVTTRVVGIAAVVRDKSGQPVGGLTRDDFTLKEDGHPEPIKYFSQGSDQPLTLALLIDTSGSQRTFIGDEERASEIFFEEMLKRPEDRATLVQFDAQVLELQALTSTPLTLKLALGKLDLPRPASVHNGTLLNDAVYAISKRIAPQPGRKAMVLLTDGGDNGSRVTLEQAVEQAQRADITIYSIFYSAANEAAPGRPFNPAPSGRDTLEQLSRQTGGKVFTVGAEQPLKGIFAEIAEDMRLTYLLGYVPPQSTPGVFHRIELRANDKHLTIQTRRGYYTK